MSPKPGEVYEHYKRKTQYRIIAVGTHTETGERLIVYESLDDDKVWIRPEAMFLEMVGDVPRFTRIENA